MNALKRWMDNHTVTEQRALAKRAKTTIGTLRFIANGSRDNIKAGLATRLDRATAGEVPREKMCADCKACEFAKAARS